jgi:putative ABC transport system substrate-binding protein
MMAIRAAAVCMIAALLGAPAHAQTSAVPRIGYLQHAATPSLGLFRQALRDLGYVEGKTVLIEHRAAEGRPDRLAGLAAEIVRLRPQVILSDGGTPAVSALMKATREVPIVFVGVADPVGQRIVASLARPGANITGISVQHPEFAPKALELFLQILPSAKRIAVLSNPRNASLPPVVRELQAAARLLEVEIPVVNVGSRDDFERAFAELAALKPAGVLILRDAMFTGERTRLAILAAKAGLPTMYGDSSLPDSGGLSSYGPNTQDMVRRAAGLVDKILKGAKPADLPVEQPAKFDFVINVATAKALGIELSQAILLRADRVIR